MRKKTIVWAYLILLSLGTILSLYIPKNEVAAKDAVVIPGQAIRLRILANSDLDKDQALKRDVRDAVNAKISVWVKDLTSIKEARKVIKSKLPEIQTTAEAVVKKEGSKQKVNVKFGKVQFPTKLYGQFLYPAGDYEAILITLGKGEGANWWCVLFPPLCFLDFSNGIAVSKGFDEGKESVAKAAEKKVEKKAKMEDPANPKPEVDYKKPEAEKSLNSASKAENSVEPKSKAASVEETDQSTDVSVDEKDQSKVAAVAEIDKSVERSVKKAPKKAAAVVNRAEKEMQLEDSQTEAAVDLPKKKEQNPKAPVYTSQDEQPIKVKFFIVELWDKIF
jgi:stage II sporulation protein R